MPRYVFAAAKDGAMYLSAITADNLETADEMALREAAEFHSCRPDETEFGGFSICPISALEQDE